LKGFKRLYGEQLESKALAGVASMIADAQTAKWQAMYDAGRDPTDQQRVCQWLVNKVVRTRTLP
jgi:hypothetical protein